LLTERSPLDSHKYFSLPLIPVEEFLEQFPEHQDTDEHELMIARINHEHAEREKLEQARQELLKRKQALIAENKKRKDDLASLDQDLEKFVDVCAYCLWRVDPWTSVLIYPCDSRPPNRFRRSSRRNTRGVSKVSVDRYIGSALLVKIPFALNTLHRYTGVFESLSFLHVH
jgi:hypothetical protein